MRAKDTARCTNCRRLQARVDALEAELAALKEVVAQLGQQLAAARKDSSTSSKPPSSDIVKPPKPPPPQGQDKRRIGGQPGHPKHERVAFPPEAVNAGSFDHRIDVCPCCGHGLKPARTIPPRVVQQVDVREVPVSIQEHRSHPAWCPRCQKMHEAPLPPGIARGGLVGPSLTTLIAYLKGACHASYSTVRKFLRDVVRVTISRGELARIIAKVGRALERPYQELLDDLPGQARLNVDETGHKQNGQRQWTWCFRAGLYTLFKIDPTRGADVLIGVLGAEFDGVLGCDYFSSYRRYQREFGILLQFCLAHLIRDVKYLTTLPDPRDRSYGERLREALRRLFAVIHRREQLSAADFRSQALLPTEWVTLDRFSDFRQHAGEDFEAEVLFVSKSVGPSLDHTDLVVDPFDEAQGYLVLLMAIRRDPVPVFLDHPGELLIHCFPGKSTQSLRRSVVSPYP